ncbi:hypothetical protein ACFWDG_15115 [Peribacillus sp. NPDC060186]
MNRHKIDELEADGTASDAVTSIGSYRIENSIKSVYIHSLKIPHNKQQFIGGWSSEVENQEPVV